MVSASVVAAVSCAVIAVVPNILDCLKALRSFPFDGLHKLFIHLFAIIHSCGFDLEGFVEEVIFRGDNVDEVFDASYIVVCAVEVNVDATRVVCESARFPKLSYQLLKGFDILSVGEDGAYQFNAVFVGC